ncbi:hypothetical protein ACJX0J_016567, partial [Zea mays]
YFYFLCHINKYFTNNIIIYYNDYNHNAKSEELALITKESLVGIEEFYFEEYVMKKNYFHDISIVRLDEEDIISFQRSLYPAMAYQSKWLVSWTKEWFIIHTST